MLTIRRPFYVERLYEQKTHIHKALAKLISLRVDQINPNPLSSLTRRAKCDELLGKHQCIKCKGKVKSAVETLFASERTDPAANLALEYLRENPNQRFDKVAVFVSRVVPGRLVLVGFRLAVGLLAERSRRGFVLERIQAKQQEQIEHDLEGRQAHRLVVQPSNLPEKKKRKLSISPNPMKWNRLLLCKFRAEGYWSPPLGGLGAELS